MQRMEERDFQEAMGVIDRLAAACDEDLDLVAQAIKAHSIENGRSIVVDIDAAERWIMREMDARAFG